MRCPPKLSGSGSLTAWLNHLREFAISNRLFSSRDIAVEISPTGTIPLLKNPGGGGGGTAYDFTVCRNGQGVTLRPLFESDPELVPDDE